MGARFRSWWQKIKQHPYATGVVGVLVLILFIFSAYRFGWDWTGFTGGESKVTTTMITPGTTTATPGATVATEKQPTKTLWDWLGLLAVLAIPVVVGLGAAWYTAHQGKVSDRETLDNQRENALQAYIDRMSELLLEKKLRESPNDEVRDIARVRTLTVFPRLDPYRKRRVLRFLYESGLIYSDSPIIDLGGADLHGADLHEIYLREAGLSIADLRGADLREADLSYADLRGAKMNDETVLDGTKLQGARYNTERIDQPNRPGQQSYQPRQEKVASIEPTQWPRKFDLKSAGCQVSNT